MTQSENCKKTNSSMNCPTQIFPWVACHPEGVSVCKLTLIARGRGKGREAATGRHQPCTVESIPATLANRDSGRPQHCLPTACLTNTPLTLRATPGCFYRTVLLLPHPTCCRRRPPSQVPHSPARTPLVGRSSEDMAVFNEEKKELLGSVPTRNGRRVTAHSRWSARESLWLWAALSGTQRAAP